MANRLLPKAAPVAREAFAVKSWVHAGMPLDFRVVVYDDGGPTVATMSPRFGLLFDLTPRAQLRQVDAPYVLNEGERDIIDYFIAKYPQAARSTAQPSEKE